jgi:hypothetical protein
MRRLLLVAWMATVMDRIAWRPDAGRFGARCHNGGGGAAVSTTTYAAPSHGVGIAVRVQVVQGRFQDGGVDRARLRSSIRMCQAYLDTYHAVDEFLRVGVGVEEGPRRGGQYDDGGAVMSV